MHSMWRGPGPLLALVSVGLCLLVDARPGAPPPAAVLAQEVLASEEATANALAAEAPQAAYGYKDLQGTVVDSSEGISNAVRPVLLSDANNGDHPVLRLVIAHPPWLRFPLPANCTIVIGGPTSAVQFSELHTLSSPRSPHNFPVLLVPGPPGLIKATCFHHHHGRRKGNATRKKEKEMKRIHVEPAGWQTSLDKPLSDATLLGSLNRGNSFGELTCTAPRSPSPFPPTFPSIRLSLSLLPWPIYCI